MAKFTYQGPEIATELFGIVFPRGQPVDVDETPENARAIAKLKANPVFGSAAVPAPEPVKKGKK